jgi:hypothetical protein
MHPRPHWRQKHSAIQIDDALRHERVANFCDWAFPTTGISFLLESDPSVVALPRDVMRPEVSAPSLADRSLCEFDSRTRFP